MEEVLQVGYKRWGLNLLGCSALLVKEMLLLVMLPLLRADCIVSQVGHLLLLHALPPCTVQLQNLHQPILLDYCHFVCLQL